MNHMNLGNKMKFKPGDLVKLNTSIRSHVNVDGSIGWNVVSYGLASSPTQYDSIVVMCGSPGMIVTNLPHIKDVYTVIFTQQCIIPVHKSYFTFIQGVDIDVCKKEI